MFQDSPLMRDLPVRTLAGAWLLAVLLPAVAYAQAAPALPPAGSPPFLWTLELCFPTQGNSPNVETETYLYYVKLRSSIPAQGVFPPWDEAAEEVALKDFRTLMYDTNFLED